MIKASFFKSKTCNSMAFFNVTGQVILGTISFLSIPIFTRLLGTENYGQVSIYLTWVQVMTILIGLQTGGTIANSKIYLDTKEHHGYCSSILSLSFCSFIIIFLIFLIFINPISNLMMLDKKIIFLILIDSFFGYIISFANINFTFNKEPHKTFLVSATTLILNISVSIFLINMIKRYEYKSVGRILGNATSSILIGIILFSRFMLKGRTLIHKRYWKFCLPICLPLIFHGLSQMILAQSDKIMLKCYENESIVGIYSLAFTFVNVIYIIYMALNNSWVPFYYDDMKSNNIESINSKTKNYLLLFSYITIGFIYLSPEVIRFFISQDFWDCIKIVPILSLGIFFMFLYSFPVNFQFYHKKTLNIALGTTLAAIFNIFANTLLIPKFSMKGAAYATLFSYIILFLFHHLVSNFIVKEEYHYRFKTFAPYILFVISSSVIFNFVEDNWLLRWSVGICLGVHLVFKIVRNKSIF